LDQCLIERITPMAWSPLGGGIMGNGARRLLPHQQGYQPEKFLPALDAIARERGTSRVAVALAWLLGHPGKIHPRIGSISPARIRDEAKVDVYELTREERLQLMNVVRS